MSKNKKPAVAYTLKGLIEYIKYLQRSEDPLEGFDDDKIKSWFIREGDLRQILVRTEGYQQINQITAERIHNVFESIDNRLNKLLDELPIHPDVKIMIMREKNTYKRIDLMAEFMNAKKNNPVHSS